MYIFNIWQVDLIFFLFFAVVYFQFYKLAIKEAKNDGAAVILLQFTTAIVSFLSIPFFKPTLPLETHIYLLLFVACIFYALYDRLQGTARKHLEVSIYSIINQLNNVFIIVLGLVVFKEQFLIKKIIGATLIVIGNGIVLFNKNKLQVNVYILIGIIASLLFAMANSIDINISKHFNLPFYIMLTTTIPGIILVIALRIRLRDVVNEAKNGRFIYYLITGTAWFLSYYFSLRAYRFGHITTVAPLQSVTVILNVIVAYFFLGEKHAIFKKCLAALLVVFGVVLVVIN